ncbi:hypothetical protein AYM40_21360 [Paraburkholderia phytofirmans OLGA172]|uniref:HTH tetR-type domain-containing protein n=1 Tax=Paraburkholderia phytofirmans OLGA172 TaxID=1417228 RepID=A0A160FQ43_9BURK|nr:hypothetical protein AYM40_21360 [Paraburkholderia phytofirmans OLGA172]
MKRAEQPRAQETRSSILHAALLEFAEKGYDAASVRSIAERIGLQHPLITYHYRSKEVLWQAVAELGFAHMRAEWDAHLADSGAVSSEERLKLAYGALFRFTVKFPEFDRLMRWEMLGSSSRLQWLVDTVLKPLIDWLLPQISDAQARGALPEVEPILFHYLMMSLTSSLASFRPELTVTSKLSPSDPTVVDAYWRAVESMIFERVKVLK